MVCKMCLGGCVQCSYVHSHCCVIFHYVNIQIFSHFIADGLLQYFQVFATENCAIMNNIVHVCS